MGRAERRGAAAVWPPRVGNDQHDTPAAARRDGDGETYSLKRRRRLAASLCDEVGDEVERARSTYGIVPAAGPLNYPGTPLDDPCHSSACAGAAIATVLPLLELTAHRRRVLHQRTQSEVPREPRE